MISGITLGVSKSEVVNSGGGTLCRHDFMGLNQEGGREAPYLSPFRGVPPDSMNRE